MFRKLFEHRRIVYAVLVFVLAADATVYLGWIRNPDVAGEADPAVVASSEAELEALRGEAVRLRKIDEGVPLMGSRARTFMNERLLGDRDGYRILAQDLNNAARRAGVTVSRLNGTEKADSDRPGLSRIEMTTDVEGSFAGLLRFMDTLERNPRLYLLTELSLRGGNSGKIEVQVKTVTYFRRGQG